MIEARRITVRGRVQGVGFRPFVYEQARLLGLKGTVQNNMDGVRIVVEGEPRAIDRLLMRLKKRPPRLSRVDQVLEEKVPVKGYRDFVIQESDRRGDASVVIPVDAAVCEECLEEMFDPENFRYRYPFINCTQCGPRYTIIEELPYDRPFTAMKSFTMCERCASEYHDAGNRRHHAQPIACPECGPKLILFTIGGEKLAEGERALQEARIRLERGEIVAVKGLGGYHLACDAFDEAAVRRLREGKRRPRRPLAVMVRSLEEARRLCLLSEAEEKMLASPESPIVILDRRSDAGLPELLAPGLGTLGVMLPYTPLHHLLFADGSLRALVMTSAIPPACPFCTGTKRRSIISRISPMRSFPPTGKSCTRSMIRWCGSAGMFPFFIAVPAGLCPIPCLRRIRWTAWWPLAGNRKMCLRSAGETKFFSAPTSATWTVWK